MNMKGKAIFFFLTLLGLAFFSSAASAQGYTFIVDGPRTVSEIVQIDDGDPPPANDDVANAIAISSLPYTNTQSTVGATIEVGEPENICAYSVSASVWYSYTPGTAGFFAVDTVGSDYDTVLHVYEDQGGGSYRPVSCNDDNVDFQSRGIFYGEAGQSYLIGVAEYGDSGSGGNLTLNMDTYACPADAICATVFDHRGYALKWPEIFVYSSGEERVANGYSGIAGYVEVDGLSPGSYDVDIVGIRTFISDSGWGLGYQTASAESLSATMISALDISGNPTIDGNVYLDNGRSPIYAGLFYCPNDLTMYISPGTYNVFIKDSVEFDYVLLSEGETIGAGGASITLDASTMPVDEITFDWDGFPGGDFWFPAFENWDIHVGYAPDGHLLYTSHPDPSYTLDVELFWDDGTDFGFYNFYDCCQVTGSPDQVITFMLGGILDTDLKVIDAPYHPGDTGRLETVVDDAYGNVLYGIEYYDADAATHAGEGSDPPKIVPDRPRLFADETSHWVKPSGEGKTTWDRSASIEVIPVYEVEDALGNPITGSLVYPGFRAPYEFDIPDPANTGNWHGEVTVDLGPYQADGTDTVDFGVYIQEPSNVGFYVPSKYRWYLKNDRSDGWSNVTSFGFGGVSELIPVAGDWDGDDIDTAGFYKPSQWRWYLKNDQNDGWGAVTGFRWGGNEEMIPITGDWDGDGTDNVGFYKPSTYTWYLKTNQNDGWNGITSFLFGGASENIPITGDWDGDGVDGVGFFVPSQRHWYLKNDLVDGWSGVTAFNWGTMSAYDMDPVAGDWDGDGVDTVGAYVADKWRWFLKDDQTDGWSNVSPVKFAVTAAYEAVAGDWE